mmetsp:Transcript_8808/g.23577  ORF Transcript_8808/g.23577 Transcript_8808/m.23577 type:complete len:253 (+) Transcript_8808:87-845(+)
MLAAPAPALWRPSLANAGVAFRAAPPTRPRAQGPLLARGAELGVSRLAILVGIACSLSPLKQLRNRLRRRAADDDDASSLSRLPAAPRWSNRLERRRRQQQTQPLPPGVSPYAPGEGYGSNVIPFAGIAPKAEHRRRSPTGKREMTALIKKAKNVDRIKRIEALRNRDTITQTIPIPEDRLELLDSNGWLEVVAEENGCSVAIDEDDSVEEHGERWRRVFLTGPPEDVRAGMLQLMSCIAPQRAGLSAVLKA